MARVYSTQFAALRIPSGTNATLYTVPPGYVAVVRDINASTTASGAGGHVDFFLTNETANVTIWWAVLAASQLSAQWHGRTVLNPGEILRTTPPTADLDVVVSGYLLVEGPG